MRTTGEHSGFLRQRNGWHVIVAVSTAVIVWACSWSAAQAATLFVSPNSGTYDIGGTIAVGLYAESSDQALNAVSANLTFSQAAFEIVGIDTGGTIVDLWSVEPTYDNASGSLSFEGIVLNPGYTGSAGKIATVSFRAKSSGSATLRFSSGSILAHDGQGTNILEGFGHGTYIVAAPADDADGDEPAAAPEAETSASGLPGAPTVASATHPDQNTWYAEANPAFSWTLPAGIDGVNVLADRAANTDPGTVSDGLRSTYTFTDVDEGQWYFHIRFHNSAGWGAISHFGFRIDTVAPSAVSVSEAPRTSDDLPAVLLLAATDSGSGIAAYEIRIDDGEAYVWIDDGTHRHTLPPLTEGEHTVYIRALDAAGNAAATELSLAIPQTVAAEAAAVAEREAPAARASWPLVRIIILLGLLFVIGLGIVGRNVHIVSRKRVRQAVKRNSFARSERALRKAFVVMRRDMRRSLRAKNPLTARKELERGVRHLSQLIEEELQDVREGNIRS